MQVFKAMHGHAQGEPAHKAFFEEIEKDPGNNWFAKILSAEADKYKGTRKTMGLPAVDHKSAPLLTPTYLECNDQLCLMNTPDAMYDKFLMMAQRWQCGRGSEVKLLAWEDILDDPFKLGERHYVVGDWQAKVSETKAVPLLPGADDPRLCVLIGFGDFFVAGHGNLACPQNTPIQHYIFPSMARARGGGTDIISVSVQLTTTNHNFPHATYPTYFAFLFLYSTEAVPELHPRHKPQICWLHST